MKLLRLVVLGMGFMLLMSCETTNSANKISNGSKAILHTKLAYGYMQQQQFAVAKEELEKALSADPANSEANYVMALLMIELDQYAQADKHFEKAVRSDPENAQAAHDYGTFLCRLGREKESLAYFELAAKNPLFRSPQLSLTRAGECLLKAGDTRGGEYLEQALVIDPTMGPALYRLAELRYKDQNYFNARAFIERYLAAHDANATALYLAYQIESKLNAMDMANQLREQLLESFPSSREAMSLRQK